MWDTQGHHGTDALRLRDGSLHQRQRGLVFEGDGIAVGDVVDLLVEFCLDVGVGRDVEEEPP